MVLKLIENPSFEQEMKINDTLRDSDLRPMRLAIPFEQFFKSKTPPDIYSGNEFIPFEKRDPLYKSILIKEFAKALVEFHKTLKDHGIR